MFQYDICTKTELSPIRKDQDSKKIENTAHTMESFCLISNKVKILFFFFVKFTLIKLASIEIIYSSNLHFSVKI